MRKRNSLDKNLKRNEFGYWYFVKMYKGKRYSETLQTKDINEARKKRDEYNAMLKLYGRIIDQSEETQTPVFGKVCLDWFEFKKARIREATLKAYQTRLNTYILKSPFCHKLISDVEPIDIEEWWGSLKETNDVKNTTVNSILTSLSNIFKYAMKKKLVSANPVKLIDRPENEPNRPDPFSMSEVHQIVDAVDPFHRDYLIVRFTTGMRACEINALTPFDINLKTQKIDINKSVVSRRVGQTKNESSNRAIEMSDVTLEAVKRQLKRAIAAKAQTLFFNKSGKMLDAQTFNRLYWWPIFKKVNIRYRKCKTTRHTFISNALLNREDIFWVAKYVGHTNTGMIHKHYQGYIPDEKHGQSINRVFTQQLHNSPDEYRHLSINSNT